MAYNALSTEEINSKIIVEAKKLFLENGLQKTEMQTIAQNVGIGRSTLYRYYSHKEQIAFIVMIELLEYLHSYFQFPAQPGQNSYQRLCAFCDYFIDCLLSNVRIPEYLTEFDRLFETEYPNYLGSGSENFINKMREGVHGVADVIENGVKDGSIVIFDPPQLIATSLVNTMLGLAQRLLVRTEHIKSEHMFSGEEIIRKTTSLLLSTLKAS